MYVCVCVSTHVCVSIEKVMRYVCSCVCMQASQFLHTYVSCMSSFASVVDPFLHRLYNSMLMYDRPYSFRVTILLIAMST